MFFPAPSITSLAVGQGADGFAHFVGRRTVRKNGADVVDVAHAIQYQSGRPLSEWHSLGNPRRDPATGTRVGTPVVAVAPGGSTYVFMENASGSLAVRRESAAGKWQPWQGIKGEGVRDGIAPVALESGLVEVLSPAEGAALYCHQPKADTDLVSGEDVPVAPAGHSLAGLETAPGRVTYYWTDAATHGVLAHRAGRVIPLGGSASEGRIAVLRAVIDGLDHTVTAHRATDGQIVVGICVTEDESAGDALVADRRAQHRRARPRPRPPGPGGRRLPRRRGRPAHRPPDGPRRLRHGPGRPGLTPGAPAAPEGPRAGSGKAPHTRCAGPFAVFCGPCGAAPAIRPGRSPRPGRGTSCRSLAPRRPRGPGTA